MNQIVTSPCVATDKISVEADKVKGVRVLPRRLNGRAPEKCCRGTIPGYTQIVTAHDGTNHLVGERHGWVTHIAHQPRLTQPQHHEEDNVHIYLLSPRDVVVRVTIELCEMQIRGMDYPQQGIWQLVGFHRPGTSGLTVIPRLLVSIGVQSKPVWH